MSDFEGSKAQIAKAFVIREHFEQAAKLNPNDALCHSLLGRWAFEIASLSWINRNVRVRHTSTHGRHRNSSVE